jgi:hypothetical protein
MRVIRDIIVIETFYFSQQFDENVSERLGHILSQLQFLELDIFSIISSKQVL